MGSFWKKPKPGTQSVPTERSPSVSSEGGLQNLRAWRGTSSEDYAAACALLSNENLVACPDWVIWDIGGPGNPDVVRLGDEHIAHVRMWPDDGWTEEQTREMIVRAATARFDDNVLAELVVRSGYLLALWGPEDAAGLSVPYGDWGFPQGLGIDGAGVYLRVLPGLYEVTACRWEADGSEVTKLDLRRPRA